MIHSLRDLLRHTVRLPRYVVLIPIVIYRKVLSPLVPPHCIYHPSCSAYAYRAVARHGVVRGLLLAIPRVIRCSALFTGGYDPVPEEFSFRHIGNGFAGHWRRRVDGREE